MRELWIDVSGDHMVPGDPHGDSIYYMSFSQWLVKLGHSIIICFIYGLWFYFSYLLDTGLF